MIGDLRAPEISPRLYKVSTIVAGIIGTVFLAGSVSGLVYVTPIMGMIYPGIGLVLTVLWKEIRCKPYRFLITFPLLGQAVYWRTFFIDIVGMISLEKLLEILVGDLGVVGKYIVLLSIVRWFLFPVPGFGGAQASLALSDYLYYKVFGSIPWPDSPLTPLTSLWLFGEWFMFYKALRRKL